MSTYSDFMQADPTKLDALQLALNQSDPQQALAPIGMKRIEIGYDALEQITEIILPFIQDGSVSLVVDSTLIRRGNEDLKALVMQKLSKGFTVNTVVLGVDSVELHADEEAIAEAAMKLSEAHCVVVVGSGTIVDICKDVTRNLLDCSLIVIQTAASVNAFSDNMAVLQKNGVKRTVPSRWPDALIIDLQVIADAPAAMNLAGFGDLLSMWTAPVDWYLADALGMTHLYQESPYLLLRGQGRQLLDSSKKLNELNPAALDLLAKVLTLSGIAMGVAGTTALLSGTEHLISHLIDMSAHDRPLALHGAQVAVSTIFVTAAWEKLLEEFDPASINLESCFPVLEAIIPLIHQAFDPIDPTGNAARECITDYSRKLLGWQNSRDALSSFLSNWQIHKAKLADLLLPAALLGKALKDSGSPVRYRQLNPEIPSDIARWALHNCHLMRERFTLADFLFFTGQWTDEDIEAIILRTELAGGGL